MDVGGLFQWLNSEACLPFYASLTHENRSDIAEQCMTNAEFIEAASAFVQDTATIRQKLETKLGQLCKKMSNTVKSEQDVKMDEVDLTDDRGTHIGSGFWLKREGHLIKMTSPEWTIYY
jgi:hypothetical protein